jgi:hypothetical protein
VNNRPGQLKTLSLRGYTPTRQRSGLVFDPSTGTAKQEAVVLTDLLLFRLARSPRLVRLLSGLRSVRELERKLQTTQRPCCGQRPEPIDRSALEEARRLFGTCPDALLKDIKDAMGVTQFTVTYRSLDGQTRAVTR